MPDEPSPLEGCQLGICVRSSWCLQSRPIDRIFVYHSLLLTAMHRIMHPIADHPSLAISSPINNVSYNQLMRHIDSHQLLLHSYHEHRHITDAAALRVNINVTSIFIGEVRRAFGDINLASDAAIAS